MVRIVKPRVPGLTYTSLRQHVNPMVDDTFRNIYDNLVYLRARVMESVSPTTQTPVGQLLKLTTKPPAGISTSHVMVDTHLVRTTTYTAILPVSGTTFYEYDRNAFYIVAKNLAGVTDWRLIVAVMEDVIGNRPTDLGIADNGFIFLEVPTHKFYVWDNPTWFELRATALFQYGLYSARPAVTIADNGLAYYATDQNTLYIVEAGAWVWLAGIMAGTIAPDQRPALVAGDVGFLFYGTDNFQLYRWNGATWDFAIPDASVTVRGVVTTGTQSFIGTKTFTGITKLGDGTTNYANFDTSGRLTLVGNARTHREVRVEVLSTRNGSSAPTDAFRAVGASGTVLMAVKQFSKTTQQDIYWIFHAPSEMDYTAPANFHLMWQPGAAWTTGNYLWKLEYLVLNGSGDLLLSGTPTTIQADVTPADATHNIETVFVGDITLALDQIMICHFFRDVAGDNGDDVGSVSMLELHYTANKLGEPI